MHTTIRTRTAAVRTPVIDTPATKSISAYNPGRVLYSNGWPRSAPEKQIHKRVCRFLPLNFSSDASALA
jgi:hypothetical protein